MHWRARRGLAIGCLLLGAAATLPTPAQAASWSGQTGVALRVIPFPGTPDASPASQVIFSALAPTQLRWVTVIGSQSGRHDGRLEALPAGAGTAFVPNERFTPGETVSVDAALRSAQAGTVSGDPGATHLRFSFGVAAPMHASPLPSERPRGPAKLGYGPTQSFTSEPKLHPPAVTAAYDPDTSSGDIFVTPENSPQVGPMIMNSSGQLVWFHPLGHRSQNEIAANLAVQRYEGQPVLTWWQGEVHGGVVGEPSEDVLMNSHYRRVAVVHAGYGDVTDLHEFQLTPQGTAYLDSAVTTKADLTSVGGPADGLVVDYVIQEIDVKTGRVLWEWHALGHVPVSASYWPYQPNEVGYDYFHLNSIQQLPDGNLLVSSRDTCAVYEISRSTGKIIWTLGGKYSSFRMGPDTTFWWQHDARLRGHTLSLFDDGSSPQKQPQSSAEYLNLDIPAMTVSLIKRYTHYPPLLASAGGATQTLANGNVFVGWGSQPHFSEFTPGGQMIFDGSFALRVVTYRAFRFPWIGEPDRPPSLAVSPDPNGHVTAYATWNGATQVTGWRVLGGSSPDHLKPLLASARLTGFETAIDVPSQPRYLAVQALDANGGVLGTSAARPDPPHLAVFGPRVFVATSSGHAAVPVGCLARQACRVTVTIKSRNSVRGRSTSQVVPADRAALVEVSLSAAGRHELRNATEDRLPVKVIVRSGSGPSPAATDVTLVPYSSTGAPASAPIGFVSATGQAAILSACYASAPCRIHETLTASGRVIARTRGRVILGAEELAYAALQLNGPGRRMLARAKGNLLPAEITVTTNAKTTSHRIDLVGYR